MVPSDTMMDALVALTAAYRAEGKRITFQALRPSAVKMLRKADYWTKQVSYEETAVQAHTEHASLEGADHYSKHANIKRRITGLNAPSWSDAPGPGIYEAISSPTAEATPADEQPPPEVV